MTRLQVLPWKLSLSPTRINWLGTAPVNTPRSVLKSLPMVSMVVGPLAVAGQIHHTDAPPKFPAKIGSWPKVLVAPTLLPVTVAIGPLIGFALKKLSFVWG